MLLYLCGEPANVAPPCMNINARLDDDDDDDDDADVDDDEDDSDDVDDDDDEDDSDDDDDDVDDEDDSDEDDDDESVATSRNGTNHTLRCGSLASRASSRRHASSKFVRFGQVAYRFASFMIRRYVSTRSFASALYSNAFPSSRTVIDEYRFPYCVESTARLTNFIAKFVTINVTHSNTMRIATIANACFNIALY